MSSNKIYEKAMSMPASKLFEGVDLSQCTPEQISMSRKLYNYIAESAAIAQEEKKPLDDVLDEGILGGILGGVVGATAGPAIMKAICNALGISESGTLGRLLTSRVVIAAVGAQLGYN